MAHEGSVHDVRPKLGASGFDDARSRAVVVEVGVGDYDAVYIAHRVARHAQAVLKLGKRTLGSGVDQVQALLGEDVAPGRAGA